MKTHHLILIFALLFFSFSNAKSPSKTIIIQKNIINIEDEKFSRNFLKSLQGIVGEAVTKMHIKLYLYHTRFKVKTLALLQTDDNTTLQADYLVTLDVKKETLKKCKKRCKIKYMIRVKDFRLKKDHNISTPALLSARKGYIKIDPKEKVKSVETFMKILKQ